MAEICPVCNKKINFKESLWAHEVEKFEIHDKDCILKYRENPEKYGGKAIKKTETDIAAKIKVEEEFDKLQKEIKDKSVYVKGFRMPFGDMVTFIFKWTMASIPTAIFLAILFLIFIAIST